jgi:acetylornithine deacetylase/succinyl-diaminopimelate desuccinylase-like protein
MSERYPVITEGKVKNLLTSYVKEAEGIPLKGYYHRTTEYERNMASFKRLYGLVLGSAEELSGEGSTMHSALWSIKNRPVLVASNHPVPERPTHKNLKQWDVDAVILVHADVVKKHFGAVDEPWIDEDNFFHGIGSADMKWDLIPAVAAITRAPQNVNVALIAYATEEEGNGDDIVQLVRRGLKPRISLCADGGPIEDDNPHSDALISIVPNAKGVLRGGVSVELGYKGFHSARLHKSPLPIIPVRLHDFRTDLFALDEDNIRHPGPDKYFGRTWNIFEHTTGAHNVTANEGYIGFEIRSGSLDALLNGEAFLKLLARRHGLIYTRNKHDGLLIPFSQDPTVEEVQIFDLAARQAAGTEKVIYQDDYGSMDNRHLPVDVARITHGIRSGFWHSYSSAEKVSLEAIMAYIDTYIGFVNKL